MPLGNIANPLKKRKVIRNDRRSSPSSAVRTRNEARPTSHPDQLKEEEADQKFQDDLPRLPVNKISVAAEIDIRSKIEIAKAAAAHRLPPKVPVEAAKKLPCALSKIPSFENRRAFPQDCSRNDMMIRKLARLGIKSRSSINDFKILAKVGEGAYGAVFRAVDKRNNEIVALKQFKSFDRSTEREISHLFECQPHPFIVEQKDVVFTDDSVYLVMEHADTDLYRYIKSLPAGCFSEQEAKPLMLQLLWGVAFLHGRWLFHRDLKTSNIVLTGNGTCAKLCDFGLCRRWRTFKSSLPPLLSPPDKVVTLWFRAPELLLGAANYTRAIDMWSLGCVMAEMLLGQPIFPGKTEFLQAGMIFSVLGIPTERSWPGFKELPGAELFGCSVGSNHRSNLADIFAAHVGVLSDDALDLLSSFLTYDPSRRIDAASAMKHPWFRGVPKPAKDEWLGWRQ